MKNVWCISNNFQGVKAWRPARMWKIILNGWGASWQWKFSLCDVTNWKCLFWNVLIMNNVKHNDDDNEKGLKYLTDRASIFLPVCLWVNICNYFSITLCILIPFCLFSIFNFVYLFTYLCKYRPIKCSDLFKVDKLKAAKDR